MGKINIGDTVLVKKYKITGTVIEKISDKKYRVKRKNQSFIVNKEELMVIKIEANYDDNHIIEEYDHFDYIYEVDLHGFTKVEALKEVSSIIESASFHHYPIIKITHGKGKGILRMAIHELLKEYKEKNMIKAYEFAPNYKGGYGVTIVYI